MEFKIIQTKNYLLVVSDAEIKKGDGYLTFKLDETTKWQTSIPDEVKIADLNKTNEFMVLPYSKYCKKIIAHLPLNGAPYLDGVDVLPEIENNVDVMEVFDMACDLLLEVMSKNPPPREEAILRTNQIKELNQPKHPIAFECEADTKIIDSLAKQPHMMIGLTIKSYFKTITNADGRAQWIGTYKF
jgi:hypothetical protein